MAAAGDVTRVRRRNWSNLHTSEKGRWRLCARSPALDCRRIGMVNGGSSKLWHRSKALTTRKVGGRVIPRIDATPAAPSSPDTCSNSVERPGALGVLSSAVLLSALLPAPSVTLGAALTLSPPDDAGPGLSVPPGGSRRGLCRRLRSGGCAIALTTLPQKVQN